MADATPVANVAQAVTEQAKAVAEQAVPLMQQYAQDLLQWLKEGKEFAQAQAPDLARQIISWGVVSNLVLVGVSLSMLLFTMLVGLYFYRNWEEIDWDDEPEGPIFFVIAMVTCFIGFFGFVSFWVNLYHTMFVYVAPKVYLIEYLSALIKK